MDNRSTFKVLSILAMCYLHVHCGKIKIVDEPFAFNNAAGGMRNQGDRGDLPLIARFKPKKPSGPPYLIQHLYGKCFTMMSNNYKYEFCPFANVTQREQTYRWNAFHGVLGVWKEWNIINDTFSSMHMVHGDICAGTLDREIKVCFTCGEQNEIVSVKEPSMCRYEMQFKTPYVCPDDALHVYPMLSVSGKEGWRKIEEAYFMNEITKKGYEKKRSELFIDEGLNVDEKSEESQFNTAVRNKNVVAVNPAKSNPDKENTETYHDLLQQFHTKAQCVEEYRKLLMEVKKLREKVRNLTEADCQHDKNEAVRFSKLHAENGDGTRAHAGNTIGTRIEKHKRGDLGSKHNSTVDPGHLRKTFPGEGPFEITENVRKMPGKEKTADVVERKSEEVNDTEIFNVKNAGEKRKGDEGLINEEKNPLRHLVGRIQYSNNVKNRMKVHSRLRTDGIINVTSDNEIENEQKVQKIENEQKTNKIKLKKGKSFL